MDRIDKPVNPNEPLTEPVTKGPIGPTDSAPKIPYKETTPAPTIPLTQVEKNIREGK